MPAANKEVYYRLAVVLCVNFFLAFFITASTLAHTKRVGNHVAGDDSVGFALTD